MTRNPRNLIVVRTRPGHRMQGILRFRGLTLPVALGRGGILANKREGDGGTPRGRFRLKRLWWRADRGVRPITRLPLRTIHPADAWCEDPADRRYNRPFRRSEREDGDRLMRTDHLYDLVIEIDHNECPRIARRGSAVFIHLARDGFSPTAGCVGLTGSALRQLLRHAGPDTCIDIR